MFVFEQVFEQVLIVPVVLEVPVVPNMLLTLPESLHIHRNLRVQDRRTTVQTMDIQAEQRQDTRRESTGCHRPSESLAI